jgi:hypothetical protein
LYPPAHGSRIGLPSSWNRRLVFPTTNSSATPARRHFRGYWLSSTRSEHAGALHNYLSAAGRDDCARKNTGLRESLRHYFRGTLHARRSSASHWEVIMREPLVRIAKRHA